MYLTRSHKDIEKGSDVFLPILYSGWGVLQWNTSHLAGSIFIFYQKLTWVLFSAANQALYLNHLVPQAKYSLCVPADACSKPAKFQTTFHSNGFMAPSETWKITTLKHVEGHLLKFHPTKYGTMYSYSTKVSISTVTCTSFNSDQ